MKYIATTRLYLLIICLMAVCCPGYSQSNILGIENGSATTVGIYIKEIATGKVLVEHNDRLAMTPASVTKTVTAATALLELGVDFRFRTQISLAGSRSGGDRSRWEGDLVIYSCGDPTTGSSEFKSTTSLTDSIIAGLKRLGISSIDGTVVIVETMKDAGPLPTWECEDLAWGYGAGLYGFNYRGNVVRVYPNKGTTVPACPLKVTTRESADNKTNQLRGIYSDNLVVWVPKAQQRKPDWNITTTNPNPAETYAGVLASRLNAAGIKTGSKRLTKDVPEPSVPVYTAQSPTAAAICRSLMKRSDNLFAEGMLRALDPSGSRGDCIKIERDLWKATGLNIETTVINDGSGLTRANRFSPRFLGQMLEHMLMTPVAQEYLDCFPVAGIDGTLKGFGAKTSLKGRLAMKTGSISSVQTYAGYRLDPNGKPTHVVVIMVNGFFCPRAALKKSIEKFLLDTFK